MIGLGAVSMSSTAGNVNPVPPIRFPKKIPSPPISLFNSKSSSLAPACSPLYGSLLQEGRSSQTHFSPKAAAASSSSSVGSTEYAEEPATGVKFQTSLSFPGCTSLFSLLGTGYREKVFAIIGVKVYAVGFYVNQSTLTTLDAWKGKSAAEIQSESSVFDSIYQAPLEKSLQIILVRDVDGKTFWDALNEAICPRLKAPTPVDESALAAFRSIFQGRPLKKGTVIILTWLNTSTMLVSVSSGGLPKEVDAKIESGNVILALFDVFFGNAPVSSTLKASVANGLAKILK